METEATQYDEIAERFFAPIYPVIADAILERTHAREGRLLDLGCGSGHLGFALLEKGAYAHAVFADANLEALEITKRRAAERGFASLIETSVQDACALDLPNESFDLIVSRGSMPFWEDQRAAFLGIYRLLAPGGWAYIGGGLGTKDLGESIKTNMAEARAENGGEGSRCFDRRLSKALADEEYRMLFKHTNAILTIVNNDDEGHWIIVGKPAAE
ncbi:class I SAM-dependent methyltransferase [Raoultibacter phocaeensis]|uniref:class I SAM-dependent methyltransferase n=1 Tax=Raoultibacter phocaeensis TaxID=2479841 RepID=UPI0011182228|nr:class I SAM-dependent methyltransferase [Raoultibacter phocaeensis]